MGLSEEQVNVMKHCVGFGNRKPYIRHGKRFYRPYRNYYYTHVYNKTWNRLVGKGYAKHGDVNGEHRTYFFLTREGLDALGEHIGVYIHNEEE